MNKKHHTTLSPSHTTIASATTRATSASTCTGATGAPYRIPRRPIEKKGKHNRAARGARRAAAAASGPLEAPVPYPSQYKLRWNRDQLRLANQKNHTFTNFTCLIYSNKVKCHNSDAFRTHIVGKQHRGRAYSLNPHCCKLCLISAPFRTWKELEDHKKSKNHKRELIKSRNFSK